MAYDVNKLLAHLFETPKPQVREVRCCCKQAMCTIHNYEKRYTVNIQNPSLSTVWHKLKAIL